MSSRTIILPQPRDLAIPTKACLTYAQLAVLEARNAALEEVYSALKQLEPGQHAVCLGAGGERVRVVRVVMREAPEPRPRTNHCETHPERPVEVVLRSAEGLE